MEKNILPPGGRRDDEIAAHTASLRASAKDALVYYASNLDWSTEATFEESRLKLLVLVGEAIKAASRV